MEPEDMRKQCLLMAIQLAPHQAWEADSVVQAAAIFHAYLKDGTEPKYGED